MNIFDVISTALDTGKNALDAGKSHLLERYLQHELGEAGTVSNLALDSRAKTLAFDLALKGGGPTPCASRSCATRSSKTHAAPG